MRRLYEVLLVSWLFAGCGAGGTPSELPGLVEHHNQERLQVSSPPLKWSDSLAAQALAWANECEFTHNPDRRSSGENLYATSTVDALAMEAAKKASVAWAAEKSDYDVSANQCAKGRMCGHYTQMVWKETTEVGCAVVSCPNGIQGFTAGTLVVCNYAPAGNYVGQRPF